MRTEVSQMCLLSCLIGSLFQFSGATYIFMDGGFWQELQLCSSTPPDPPPCQQGTELNIEYSVLCDCKWHPPHLLFHLSCFVSSMWYMKNESCKALHKQESQKAFPLNRKHLPRAFTSPWRGCFQTYFFLQTLLSHYTHHRPQCTSCVDKVKTSCFQTCCFEEKSMLHYTTVWHKYPIYIYACKYIGILSRFHTVCS